MEHDRTDAPELHTGQAPHMAPDEPSDAVTAPPDPLFEAFVSNCERLHGFDHELSVAAVDGYLTALAAGPRRVSCDEWLPRLTGDAFERVFADPEDAAQARASLSDWADRLRAALEPQRLLDHPDDLFLEPLFDEWSDEDRQRLEAAGVAATDLQTLRDGVLWAGGFFQAMEDFASDWPTPAERDGDDALALYAMLEATLGVLLMSPDSDEFRSFVAEQWPQGIPTRDELLTEAAFAAQDWRIYWLDHAPRPAPRRVAAQPGRNDPCWCGSGRKFKKCHGTADAGDAVSREEPR